MLEELFHMLKEQESELKNYTKLFSEINVSPKTVLIKEGEISQNIYFIRKGCLRLWFNNDDNHSQACTRRYIKRVQRLPEVRKDL